MRRHIPCVLALAATHALPALRSRIKKEGIQEDAKTSNGRRLPLFARFDDSFGGEPTCAVPSCVWNTLAPNAGDPADTTCIQRVNFLVMYKDKSRVDACDIVATDPRFSEICSKCPTCTVECSEVEDLKAQVEELKQFTDKLKHFFTDGCGQPCVPIKVATLPLVQGRYQVEDSNTCVEVDGDYGAFGLEIARSLSCTKVMVKSGARLGAIAVHGTDTGIVNDGEVNYISTTPQLRGQFATGTKIINTGTAIGGGPVTIGDYSPDNSGAGSDITVSEPGLAKIFAEGWPSPSGTTFTCYGAEVTVPKTIPSSCLDCTGAGESKKC